MVALHEEMDGVLLNTVPEVEEEGVLGVLDWETPAGKQVICVGPQLALTHRYDGQKTVSPTTKRKEDEAVAFLDEAHASHGSESVLFISFGSMYFPPPHQLQVLLDAVIATEKPFLMTIPGAHGDFPVELEEKVRKSDRGLLVPWVDQQAILAHAATGWILSHAGAGGTFQALSQGVPMICWPFATDQPQFSLWVTDMLDAGFYLIQNRTGPAASLKASRGGPAGMRIIGTDEAIRMELDNVLRQSQGMVGVRKRANAQKTGKAIWEFIRPEGGAWRELDKLMFRYLCSANGFCGLRMSLYP
ncbi:UDP-Glycosyltransferase/glycogen phosphorylase [Dacryopinax primogenitus]|uniref:UDP-Glycosyltransferase/glycogen phosphorylase n=1 Tax=Dacryopinax primogenitus (strain DJM 731) TaxID=1858805 RepID=M5G154_DACPD|nr:UDP-Glycosyltransferase/glycogen phosphorylase [Dacryopinax primogenitus]EJU03971.1 UDP-Glycosyltransferase/glycogen phosphorylase [Dacryopinax primogenitus]